MFIIVTLLKPISKSLATTELKFPETSGGGKKNQLGKLFSSGKTLTAGPKPEKSAGKLWKKARPVVSAVLKST